jgi:hypothetical protein
MNFSQSDEEDHVDTLTLSEVQLKIREDKESKRDGIVGYYRLIKFFSIPLNIGLMVMVIFFDQIVIRNYKDDDRLYEYDKH